MIILEEVAERTKDDKFNGLTLRHPQIAYTRSTSPLPDYETSEAQQREVTIPSSKFKLDAKSWRAALFALCIYIFLTLTIAVPIIVLKSKDNKYNQYQYPPASPVWPADFSDRRPPPNRMTFGVPSSNENRTCNNWQPDPNSPNSVMASFQLPPSGCITIRSNATYDSITSNQLNGTLSVSMNDNSQESSILFRVEMQSSSKDIHDRTTICFSEEGPNKGLSIKIPSGIDIGDDTLALDIYVLLPRVNSNIDIFTTYLPFFSQDFGDLRQYLSFDQFSLEGSHRPINYEFLQASRISATNVLASIQGSFNVTDSLYLESIKGSIIADIMLSPRSVQTHPTTLSLGTGNSAINASITLNALTTTSFPTSSPAFAAQVTNFDGPIQIDVAYGNTSLPSPFQLKVQNNVAPSIISMDSIFQGCFIAQTKLSQVVVQDTQKNTSRTLDYDMLTPDSATGWFGQGTKPASCRSFVNIFSALGPVNLTFGR